MTGKELADQLFEAFAQGTPGDDPALADRMASEIAKLSTDEMWRFVYAAGTRGSMTEDGTYSSEPCITTGKPVAGTKHTDLSKAFSAFNVEIARRGPYKAAIAAMHAASGKPPIVE